ncbi:MAG: RsmD family RNA methyltransferase, partial [Candidatus Cloacimonetes bacterium]|nr:RsmD family RNA methyltransferase [Candidatus Cloacimonadota bacterium]
IPQAINIYNHIKKNISNDPVVLDAYSGTGSIGLFIASQAKKVVFVESNTQAHQSAIENAYINNINNIEFRNAEVNNVIDNITQENLFNTVIFDPPRKGLEPETIELISKKNIPQIIYLSCNPSTQIRDVNLFIKHHYKIKEISAFDMFPHTFHIESLIILEKT